MFFKKSFISQILVECFSMRSIVSESKIKDALSLTLCFSLYIREINSWVPGWVAHLVQLMTAQFLVERITFELGIG